MVLLAAGGAVGFGGERVAGHRSASASAASSASVSASTASVGPRCVPSKLNRSAVLPGTSLAVSPLPESLDASGRTQISLLGVPAAQLEHLRVSGSSSGVHTGRLRAYSQGDGASFLPSRPFRSGETVTVRLAVAPAPGSEASAKTVSWRFTTAHSDAIKHPAMASEAASKRSESQHYRSRTDLEPPTLAITTPASPAVAPGYVMATPYSGPGQDGPMIFDNSGQVVWFNPLSHGSEATNLQVQQLAGQPVLTWWQGYIPPQGFGEGEEVIADSSYHQTKIRAGNGYWADLHDFSITPQNTALLTVFNLIHCDLSRPGGSRDAAVTDGVFQEIDLKTHLVRREWHSLDHVSMLDSYASAHSSSAEWPYDYFHINSVDLHQDGTILLSARNTSALYVLGGPGLQVTTRVGGKRSTVKEGRGTSTAYQHDATLLPNGQISVFDNGAVPKVHPESRGLLLSVNSKAGTDTLVGEFTHPKRFSSGSQGNIQGLPGGDFFVGWGPVSYFSEFNAAGQIVFEARMPSKDQSYRGYRFPWVGTPPGPPAVAAATTSAKANGAGATGATTTVYASWNGSTQVASWRVFGGASASAVAPVLTAPRSGFETAIVLPGVQRYLAVQALDASGAVLGTSQTIKG